MEVKVDADELCELRKRASSTYIDCDLMFAKKDDAIDPLLSAIRKLEKQVATKDEQIADLEGDIDNLLKKMYVASDALRTS